jgi:protocatechuate 3,4-dioxygenase beta subunit
MTLDSSLRARRRAFLGACLAAPAAFALAACGGQPTAPTAAPTTGAPTAAPATPGDPPTAVAATEVPPTAAPAAASVAATTAPPTAAPVAVLPATPECGDDDDPTPAQTEGPYYTPSTPERASLIEPGMAGTRLVVSGYVLTTDCRPVARAMLDFWQCDDAGVYDNEGYRLRGHLFTDDQGAFSLETIMPGLYPGRTRHIHVRVQAPNQPILTTQLYFPNEPANDRDGIFNPALIMDVQAAADGRNATFNFVLTSA